VYGVDEVTKPSNTI